MRFLKNRIAQAKVFREQNQQTGEHSPDLTEKDDIKCKEEDTTSISTRVTNENFINQPGNKETKVKSESKRPSKLSRETKNLVKNYGKAICNFSCSSLALPYLETFIKKEGVTLRGFLTFLQKSKVKIDGLQHFREVLLSNVKDTPQISAYRKIYREISKVFIKFFSVNWIYHSKVIYKKAHLDFRFKILRRIQNPEQFTNLKSPRSNIKGL